MMRRGRNIHSRFSSYPSLSVCQAARQLAMDVGAKADVEALTREMQSEVSSSPPAREVSI